MAATDKLKLLEELFGSYKAEWLKNKIFNFFEEPFYFSSLKSNKPCVLQGGRGTGKTTVLRGLSYQGQFSLKDKNIKEFEKNDFIGIYYRVNTNHVYAFSGKGIEEKKWGDIFGHYFNLLLCWEIVDFLVWHKQQSKDDEVLSQHACKLIARSLLLNRDILSLEDLHDGVEDAMYSFQANVNNIADGDIPKLSMPGDPIKIVTEEAEKLSQFKDKMFYILIDEYENFMDQQQVIVNSLIKHIPDSYTIKIGVRELGWRVKHTYNELESLNDPADYALINIEDQFTNDSDTRFEKFAKNVCQIRIQQLLGSESEYDIENALPSLLIEEESELLKVKQNSFYKNFISYETDNQLNIDITPLYKFFIAYWANVHKKSLEEVVDEYQKHTSKWNERYENYKYSMLFKLKKGRGSAGIQKYYAGWKTFVKLANGNIRYLMELVYYSYYHYIHFRDENEDLSKPIPAEVQTKATINVGYKNLLELETSWLKGAQMTKMVQSLGTIFKRLAQDGQNAPEIVQFEFVDEISDRSKEMLNASVMNLALVRMSANKLQGKGSIKDFQYSLHPIFAPYFTFSFRRKRKMTITDEEFLNLIDAPNQTVSNILIHKNVPLEEEKIVPTQLTFLDEMFSDEL